MQKRTVPALADFIALATGAQNVPYIARRLREAGLLSQAGHGRGAAEATAYDAALLLLVVGSEVAPLYSVQAARAILALRAVDQVSENGDGALLSFEEGGTAVDFASHLIDTATGINRALVVRGPLQIKFLDNNTYRPNGEPTGEEGPVCLYSEPERSPDIAELMKVTGWDRLRVNRWAQIPGAVFVDVGRWLRGEIETEAA